jgi:hypothetical protein
MAFKLDLSPSYEYPVKFRTIDAKGKQQHHTITLIFKRIEREEMINQNLTDETAGNRTGADVIEADLDYLMGFVEGWKDVDINGDTTFSRDNLRKLLNGVPGIHREITAAFVESANGGQQRKN